MDLTRDSYAKGTLGVQLIRVDVQTIVDRGTVSSRPRMLAVERSVGVR